MKPNLLPEDCFTLLSSSSLEGCWLSSMEPLKLVMEGLTVRELSTVPASCGLLASLELELDGSNYDAKF